MSFLNGHTLKQDIFLFSPIILWEFNYFIILRFKFSCFVLYFRLCLINRLSKLCLLYLEYICVLDLNWFNINFSISVPYSLNITTSANSCNSTAFGHQSDWIHFLAVFSISLLVYIFTNSSWLTTLGIFKPMIFTVNTKLWYKYNHQKLRYLVKFKFSFVMKSQIEVVLLGAE